MNQEIKKQPITFILALALGGEAWAIIFFPGFIELRLLLIITMIPFIPIGLWELKKSFATPQDKAPQMDGNKT